MEGSNDIGAHQYFETADFFIPELGCFLLHMCLGSFYSFGNMLPYMTSYMRYALTFLTRAEDLNSATNSETADTDSVEVQIHIDW